MLRHTHRLATLAVLALGATAFWLFVPDAWVQIDDVPALREKVAGAAAVLWVGLGDALGVEVRRRNPLVPAIRDDIREDA